MLKSKIYILTLLIAPALSVSQQKIDATVTVPYSYEEAKAISTGLASWYSKESPGINTHTANNEIFDDTELTAAMWDVPFNQKIKVTNLKNGKSVVVRVNDRGPHKRFVGKGRIIDLSKRAFSDIAPLHQGLTPIQLEFL